MDSLKKESLNSTNSENLSKVWWLLSIGVLAGLSFGAASGGAKRLVRERAGGRCESCGSPVDNGGIVGHLDHTKILAENGHRSNRYNTTNNLRLHCSFCEAEWHVQHLGKAKDIGLSEKDNDSSSMGTLISLYYHSKKQFWQLYERYQTKIDELFSRKAKDLPER